MKCTKCAKWVHKEMSLVSKTVLKWLSFVCKRFQHLVPASRDERVTLDGDNLEVVKEEY